MNSNKHMMRALTLACILSSSLSHAQTNTSFIEQVESIKKSLYKMTTHELCTILTIPFEHVPTISADQLKSAMESSSELLVVNALPKKYYLDCHIKGSISAPLSELVHHASSWNHSQKIIVYCALEDCDAGEKGCILLKHMGFTDVTDYVGGIKEWFQLGYPTQGPALSEYLYTKGFPSIDLEYRIYPETIVCSKQTRWINRYQNQ